MTNLPAQMLLDPQSHLGLIPALAQIHSDCVISDGTLATFRPDPKTGKMNMPALEAFWEKMIAEVVSGQREIVLQFASASSENATGGLELAGYASLYMPFSETGPFRSFVEKLMVSPRHRRKGIARRVMQRIEEVAEERNRGLVILDTVIGSEAAHVYPRLGYTEFGRLPRYGISPIDGSLVDEIFYFKDLRKA